MKKAFIIILSLFLLLTVGLYLTDHVLRNDPIVCPDETKVISITVAENEGEAKEIPEEDFLLFLTCIRNAVPTMKDSVNDRPYEDEYYTLDVSTGDMQYRYYVYKKGSQYYIEMPYMGIYKIHEIINIILSNQFTAE